MLIYYFDDVDLFIIMLTYWDTVEEQFRRWDLLDLFHKYAAIFFLLTESWRPLIEEFQKS